MEIFNMILDLVVLVIVLFGFVVIQKLGKEDAKKIFEMAKIFVTGAEQLGKVYGYTAEKKREIVIKALKTKFPKVSESELEKFLESAVFKMNENLKRVEEEVGE